MTRIVIAITVLALCSVRAFAATNCVNAITKFTPIGALKYELGSTARYPVSANKQKYFCGNLQDIANADDETAWYELDQIISTELSQAYLPAVSKNCSKDGIAYCCPDGIKHYTIKDVKICDLMDGQRVVDGRYKITARADPKGSAVGYSKVAAVINYVCNGEARSRDVSMRFNGKYYQKCKSF